MNEIEQCPDCGNFYTVQEIDFPNPGTREVELICCPYDGCSYSRGKRSNGVFVTRKIKRPYAE